MGDPGGASATWDVEFGIAFEVGHSTFGVVPNASDAYMLESPGSSGLERSAQSCFIYCLIFNYLAVSGLSCSTWDVCCMMQDLSLWLHHGISSCNTQAPECTGSVIMAHGISCPVAKFPQPRIEPVSPALVGRILLLDHQEVLTVMF